MSRKIYYQLVKLIRRSCKPIGAWPRWKIISWLRWYERGGRLAVQMIGAQVVGFGVVRCLPAEKVRRGAPIDAEQFEHDEKGEIAWVDLALADCEEAKRGLVQALIKSVGQRQVLAFCRGDRNFRAHIYDFNKFTQRLLQGA